MIYTVTFNPSLDYIVTVLDFKLGVVNRTNSEKILPGGKGINVSIVLKNLGFDSTALGFVGGFTGTEIEHQLRTMGCCTDFVRIKSGSSRINVKMKEQSETEINGQGPKVGETELEQLLKKLDTLGNGDMLILAGSIPSTMPSDSYEKILARLSRQKIQVIVDATGELLVNVLKYHPFLIKPNVHELGEIFNMTFENRVQIIECGKTLQQMGATNVLISMAGDGAILILENGSVYESIAPKGEVVNSVGAGDSMVAGFIAGYLAHQDYKEAFKMGLAAGSASAFSANLATKEQVIGILPEIIV